MGFFYFFGIFCKRKCLLCDLENDNDEELKYHFIYFYLTNKDNYFFKELFTKDFENKYSRRCEECNIVFSTCRKKKNHCFLLHYKQSGGSGSRPLNILKRSNLITNYSINYSLYENYYDFYDAEKTVKDVISNVENKFVSRGKIKVQGSVELINYQPAEEIDQLIELESRRTWLVSFLRDYVISMIRRVFVYRIVDINLIKNYYLTADYYR